jgi:uncharacterized protein (DUF697 family)
VPRTARGLSPFAVLSTVRGVRSANFEGAIFVDGAPALVAILARELRAGGNAAAVREGRIGSGTRDVAALVWIGEPDEDALRDAARARVPIVAVTDAEHVPYVLDTDIVRVPAGQGFPVEEVAAALARRLGDQGPSLAAALPVLREPVVDELIRSAARGNAVLAAGVLSPSVGMPILTLSQVRLVLRIAVAYGRKIDRSRAAEVLGVVGAGFGFRALAREGLRHLPVTAWAFRGGVAFAGTAAIGEAARRVFAESS